MPKRNNNFSESKEAMSEEHIALQGISYVNKKKAIKELDAECKSLRIPLENFVNTKGKKLDSGSIVAVVSHADKDVVLKQVLRSGKKLLPEAMDVLRANGLGECIEKVEIIREDVLERMYEEGKVSDDILQKLYVDSSTYAFTVELKNRMGDAPE